DPLDFGRHREAKDRLALTVRPEPLEGPSFVGDLSFRIEYLEQALVALRHGVRTALRFVDYLPGILFSDELLFSAYKPPRHEGHKDTPVNGLLRLNSCSACLRGQRAITIHIRAPRQVNHAPRLPTARWQPRMPPPGSSGRASPRR